jgi:DNA helicase HerA-like ATPase
MIDTEKRPLLALAGREALYLVPKTANRHGLIAGATGTGKTVTLQVMAETFSDMGVPVFAADIKGDLSGPAEPGGDAESVRKRVSEWGLASRGFCFRSYPVRFWDVFGSSGVPVRAAVSAVGPLLLGRLLELNETQTAVLHMVFAVARDEGLELADLRDLRRALEYVSGNAARYASAYGNISAASAGAVQRGLMLLDAQGAGDFFGEPSLDVEDFIRVEDGRGVINILAADRLVRAPRLYAVSLVWLLNRLFDVLPETGDPDKPKLVFFFDEAHLLFNNAPNGSA